MQLSKQNRINKMKLECLNHQGCLQMLVDSMREDDKQNFDGDMTDEGIINEVSKIAAHLKVMYMNDITPEPVVKQLSIDDRLENCVAIDLDKLSAIGTVKKDKTKKK